MKCVYLKKAKYIKDFQVYVSFNDGKSGIIDLRDIVFKYNIAIPLREPKNFSKFYLDSWPTLAWDCGFDIAPETIYEKCEQSGALDRE